MYKFSCVSSVFIERRRAILRINFLMGTMHFLHIVMLQHCYIEHLLNLLDFHHHHYRSVYHQLLHTVVDHSNRAPPKNDSIDHLLDSAVVKKIMN